MIALALSMVLISGLAQDAPDAASFTKPFEGVPLPKGAEISKDCDGLLPGTPYCIRFAQADIEDVGGAYMEYMESEGFTPMGVDARRVFFLKPWAEGVGCDMVQLLHVRDNRYTAEAQQFSFMSLAAHPENLCADMDPQALIQ